MSIRYNVVLSDELDRQINAVAVATENSKSEIFRKALELFLIAQKGQQEGLKFGLVEADTEKLKIEIIGL